MAKTEIDLTKHVLIPKHTKLSDKEKQELFEKYGVSIKELPKISKDDPAIASLDIKPSDVIKIIRKSPISGESVFYRGAV